MVSEPLLKVKDLAFSYGERPVLLDVDFEVPQGTTLAVLGMSGCGKTTLLRCLDGLVRPSKGEIHFKGKRLCKLSTDELYKARLEIGFVFQQAALFDSLTIFENVAFPLRQHLKLSEAEIADRVHSKLDLVGLHEVDELYPDELSGGMRKRAAIARALVLEPRLMLYDEPSAGLDPIIGARIDRLIQDLKQRLGVTSVVVTHYIKSALYLADQIMLLHEGIPRFLGTPKALLESQDPFARQFVEGYFEQLGDSAYSQAQEGV